MIPSLPASASPYRGLGLPTLASRAATTKSQAGTNPGPNGANLTRGRNGASSIAAAAETSQWTRAYTEPCRPRASSTTVHAQTVPPSHRDGLDATRPAPGEG